MTNQEAIKRMEFIREYLCAGNPIWDVDEMREVFDMAFSALEKQVPKKSYTNVIHYPYTPDLTTVRCPICKRRLRTRRTQTKGDRFCPDCGQAINWEDEE